MEFISFFLIRIFHFFMDSSVIINFNNYITAKESRKEECKSLTDEQKQEMLRTEINKYLIRIFNTDDTIDHDVVRHMDPLTEGQLRIDRLNREIYMEDGKVYDPLFCTMDLINKRFYLDNSSSSITTFSNKLFNKNKYRPLHYESMYEHLDQSRINILIEYYFIDPMSVTVEGTLSLHVEKYIRKHKNVTHENDEPCSKKMKKEK